MQLQHTALIPRAKRDWVIRMRIASVCKPSLIDGSTTMASRLSAAIPVRNVIRLVTKQSPRLPKTRPFSCTAVRAKEVANQDELPNLRHAQRPRECCMPWIDTESKLISSGSWGKAICASCEPSRQIPRESRQPPHLWPVPPLVHA